MHLGLSSRPYPCQSLAKVDTGRTLLLQPTNQPPLLLLSQIIPFLLLLLAELLILNESCSPPAPFETVKEKEMKIECNYWHCTKQKKKKRRKEKRKKKCCAFPIGASSFSKIVVFAILKFLPESTNKRRNCCLCPRAPHRTDKNNIFRTNKR